MLVIGGGSAAGEAASVVRGGKDFSSLGDLPTIVGFASGLKYRALLTGSVRGNCYVAVPADSSIQSVADLRGKRVAVAKGTATHLMGIKILETFGLGERDVRLINMDTTPPPHSTCAVCSKKSSGRMASPSTGRSCAARAPR